MKKKKMFPFLFILSVYFVQKQKTFFKLYTSTTICVRTHSLWIRMICWRSSHNRSRVLEKTLLLVQWWWWWYKPVAVVNGKTYEMKADNISAKLQQKVRCWFGLDSRLTLEYWLAALLVKVEKRKKCTGTFHSHPHICRTSAQSHKLFLLSFFSLYKKKSSYPFFSTLSTSDISVCTYYRGFVYSTHNISHLQQRKRVEYFFWRWW